MKDKKLHWVLLILLMAVSPYLYTYIQGYKGIFLISVLESFSIQSTIPLATSFILMDFIASLLLAFLLSLPLGYVTKERSWIFGILLGISLLLWLLWVEINYKSITTAFMLWVRIGEYTSMVVAFIIMARVGFHIRNIREKNAI